MNHNTFEKGKYIQGKIEELNMIKNALSHSGSIIKIEWIEKFPISVYKRTVSLNRSYDPGLIEAMEKYIESRIAEIEKEFEAL